MQLAKKRNIGFWVWVVLLSLMLMFLVWFFVFKVALFSYNFPERSFVGKTEVSNLSLDEATKQVAKELTSGETEAQIILKHNGKEWKWKGSDFEVLTQTQKLVEKSHRIARQASRESRLETMKEIKQMGIEEPLPIRLVLAGLTEKVEEICMQEECEPVEAKVVFSPESANKFSVAKPVSGKKVNKPLLINQIDAMFEKSNQIELEVPFVEVAAKESYEEVQARLKLRSTFVTTFDEPNSGRGKNIALSLSKINGTMLQPGEEFSFNKTVGSFGEENGFQKAKIILNGEFVDAYGGGACQSSTTVFNAALLANLNILESHCHSLQVGYVRQGFDAMVSPGTSDMRFVNNFDFPIFIAAKVVGNEAIVDIYGKELERGTKIEMRNEVLKTVPHTGDKIIPDEDGSYSKHVLYKGEFHRLKPPKDGCETNSWVDVLKNGKLVSSKLLRKNIYAPQQGVLVEGTEDLPAYLRLPAKVS